MWYTSRRECGLAIPRGLVRAVLPWSSNSISPPTGRDKTAFGPPSTATRGSDPFLPPPYLLPVHSVPPRGVLLEGSVRCILIRDGADDRLHARGVAEGSTRRAGVNVTHLCTFFCVFPFRSADPWTLTESRLGRRLAWEPRSSIHPDTCFAPCDFHRTPLPTPRTPYNDDSSCRRCKVRFSMGVGGQNKNHRKRGTITAPRESPILRDWCSSPRRARRVSPADPDALVAALAAALAFYWSATSWQAQPEVLRVCHHRLRPGESPPRGPPDARRDAAGPGASEQRGAQRGRRRLRQGGSVLRAALPPSLLSTEGLCSAHDGAAPLLPPPPVKKVFRIPAAGPSRGHGFVASR